MIITFWKKFLDLSRLKLNFALFHYCITYVFSKYEPPNTAAHGTGKKMAYSKNTYYDLENPCLGLENKRQYWVVGSERRSSIGGFMHLRPASMRAARPECERV